MEKIINLKDLLVHEILDLYSGEEQIIDALPKMIEKASDAELKNALTSHLAVTQRQKERLDKIKKVMGEDEEEKNDSFFSNLFGGAASVKCKGIEGLIKQAEKIMEQVMSPETMDAAIIGAAQKIEHYEIAGYGTAFAYASELNLQFIGMELKQTLNEEYEADDSLTELAIIRVNTDAEFATKGEEGDDYVYDADEDDVKEF
jgi:ferritin-like metal-binding protein YciE